MPKKLAVVVPADVSSLATINDALEWSKLKADQWKSIASALGDEDLDDFPTIAMVSADDWRGAITGSSLNAIAKARLGLFVNAVRRVQNVEPMVLNLQPPASAAPHTEHKIIVNTPVPASEDPTALKVSHYFDQTGPLSKLVVKTANSDELLKMRGRWLTLKALEPGPSVSLSDNQLSVLFRLQELGHNVLAFDMGIWGPYSERRERALNLTIHYQNSSGQWLPKEISGAHCLDDWLDAWAFATAGFIVSGSVSEGIADAYRENFKKLCGFYPKSWWICAQADWEFRHEFAPTELRRQRLFHATNPGMSSWDEAMPWNSVLLAGTTGLEAMQFWTDHLKERARRWAESGQADIAPSWVRRQADLYSTGAPHRQAQQSPPPPPQAPWGAQAQRPAGTGRRALKRKLHEAAASTNWTDVKRSDGGYRFSTEGVEICYAWNRGLEACGATCTQSPPRAHVCELCREGHKAIRCNAHPNWTPPVAKGKGKKGSKKGKSGKF